MLTGNLESKMLDSAVGKERGTRKSNFLFCLYTVITLLIYILPYTKFVVPYIPAAIAMLVSFPLLVLYDKCFWNYGILLGIVSFLLCIFGFVTGAAFVDAINEGVRNIRFFIPALWGVFALKNCERKQCIFLLLMVAILIGYILYNTFEALANDPWIVRILAKGKETSSSNLNFYRLNNVGGFEFAYMMGIITICLVWGVFQVKSLKPKVVLFVLSVISFYFIIQTMYMTLLMLTSLGILLLFYLKSNSQVSKVLMVVVFCVIALTISNLFEWLSSTFPEESLLSTKFSQMYEASAEGDVDSLGSRPELIKNALSFWIKRPIFGNYVADINSHSMIIAMLVQMGIFGLSIWSILFFKTYKLVMNSLEEMKYDCSLFKVVSLYVLLLAVFNPINYIFEITIAAYFITPLWIKVFSRKIT